MKIPDCHLLPPAWRTGSTARRRRQGGFTLVETAVTTSVFTLIMGSVLYLYIFSARASSGICQQLLYGNQARVTSIMANEIKSAVSIAIQNYDGTNFTTVASGSAQQGNALSLTISNSSSNFQVLYWLTTTGTLYRATVNTTRSRLYLSNITNSLPFSFQDYSGTILSNPNQRTLVDIDLFCLDPNPKNFRQVMYLNASVENRN